MSQRPMQQVLIRMPPDLYAALKQHAETEDRTIAAEVRRAVRRYLNEAREVSEFKHVGRQVQDDEELKDFARREWANPEFRAWAAQMRGQNQ